MKINTSVKLSKNSYSDNDRYNPLNIIGKVVEIKENTSLNPIIVEWGNGIRNSYPKKVLIIIEPI